MRKNSLSGKAEDAAMSSEQALGRRLIAGDDDR